VGIGDSRLPGSVTTRQTEADLTWLARSSSGSPLRVPGSLVGRDVQQLLVAVADRHGADDGGLADRDLRRPVTDELPRGVDGRRGQSDWALAVEYSSLRRLPEGFAGLISGLLVGVDAVDDPLDELELVRVLDGEFQFAVDVSIRA
jgi:hypothetical protein